VALHNGNADTMSRDPFDGLTAFLIVADQASFSKAGRRLGITSGAVSQAIAKLESRLGLPLFQRTTRRVALTEAGRALHNRLRPAASEIADAIESLNQFRDQPVGNLRITVPRIALPIVIEPIVAQFRRDYPEISVEINVEDAAVDISTRGFDAGIRLGGSVEADMVAVRLTPEITWSVVGSPAYFAARGRPKTPEELKSHECILYRFPTSGAIHRWEFMNKERTFAIDVPGKVITSDSLLLIALARRGVGLTYSADVVAEEDIAAGRLEPVLKSFFRKTPGLYLYFPARMQTQPKLRTFIDTAVKFLKVAR
jgi:DNA-binding transcriptional LysR family regulator